MLRIYEKCIIDKLGFHSLVYDNVHETTDISALALILLGITF